jgi:2-methylcitrate dehydratase PrpD
MAQTETISAPVRTLSRYIAAALGTPLPDDVVTIAKHRILDTLAAMISGAQLVPGRAAIKFVRGEGGPKRCTVAGSRFLTTAINAALANGMTAHADETDDTHQGARFHPGCTVVPAALAMAELLSRSGEDMIRAVALGYDVGTRFNQALGSNFMIADIGHASSVGALFAAAASATALAGHDEAEVRQALSYTAQQASGLPCWVRDPDHIEKAFDLGGMHARNAVSAAQMVSAGFTGVADSFSGMGNFFGVFSEEARPEIIADALGERFEVLYANMKKWPVAMPAQSPLDSLQVLIETHGVSADMVTAIDVTLPSKRYVISDNSPMPDVCLQHLLPLMLVDGTVGFANSHDYSRMTDEDILALRALVRIIPSTELDEAKPPRQAIVELTLKDGRTLRHHTKAVAGSAAKPMTDKEVIDKVTDLTDPVLGGAKTRQLIDTVLELERQPDLTVLRPLLQP